MRNAFVAKTATANYIRSRRNIDIEVVTDYGERVTVTLPVDEARALLEGDEERGWGGLEDAVLEAEEHRNRGAAGPWDRGRAA